MGNMSHAHNAQITEEIPRDELNTMLGCDFCGIWYHKFCLKKDKIYQKNNRRKWTYTKSEFYEIWGTQIEVESPWRCPKCDHWVNVLNNATNHVLLKNNNKECVSVTYEDWNVKWKPSPYLWQVEDVIIQQILLGRIWDSLAKQVQQELVSETLLSNHYRDAKITIFNMKYLIAKLDLTKQKAIDQGESFLNDHRFKISKLCSVETKEVIDVDAKINLKVKKENVQNFLELKKICIEVNKDNKNAHFKLLKGDVYKLFLAFRKASKMDTALDLVEKKKALRMNQVEKLLEELETLGLSDMRAVCILKMNFENKISDLSQLKDLLECGWMTTSGNTELIRDKIKDFGKSNRTADLPHVRYEEFKKLFQDKHPIAVFTPIISNLKVEDGVDCSLDIEPL